MEIIGKIQPAITTFLSIAAIGTILYNTYRSVKDPEEKQAGRIDLMDQRCLLTHKGLGLEMEKMAGDLDNINRNHLTHIEADIKELRESHIRIETILNERLPSRN